MKTLKTILKLSTISLLFAFCSSNDPDDSTIQPVDETYKVVSAFPKLTFIRPVDLQQPNDGTNRIFVVEQAGVISVFPHDEATAAKTTFLDMQSKVQSRGNEQGLLGLAFHPDYKTNGYFYVNYTATNPDRSVISRFKVSSNKDQADPASEQILFTVPDPYSNHNGGQITFGPDGYLYIALGDGGSGGDPQKNGQNRAAWLGKIHRIDVNKSNGSTLYGIPADNPFAGNNLGYREEIYAYGLRNPWRFSFDASTKQLWVGDVGQNTYEEIDIVEKGGNYGWNTMEARHTFGSGGDQTGMKLPVWEYGRSEGVSITGGFVYRGTALTGLKGKYIYADYGSRKLWMLDPKDMANPSNKEILTTDFSVSSFGVDLKNELFICGFDGKIYTLDVVK
jgi:glucose/arabinose dehydrogenase